METLVIKPSEFAKASACGSIFQKSEAETIAKNIMKILERTGNEWRKLTYQEYETERLKDGHYSSREEKYFNLVIDYCSSPDKAKSFAPDLKKI